MALRCCLLALVLFATVGCLARRTDVTKQTVDLTGQHNEVRDLINDQVKNAVNKDLAAIESRAAEDRAAAKEAMDRANAANDKAQAAEQAARELGRSALMVADMATGGRVSAVVDGIETKFNTRAAAAEAEIRAAREKAEAAANQAGSAQTTANEAKTLATKFNEQLATLDKDTATKIAALELDEATLKKLGSLPTDTMGALNALKDNETAFREKLRSEVGTEISAKLEGLSPEQIMALLTAAAAATGAGAAFGKTGKSRSAVKVESLESRVTTLEAAK